MKLQQKSGEETRTQATSLKECAMEKLKEELAAMKLQKASMESAIEKMKEQLETVKLENAKKNQQLQEDAKQLQKKDNQLEEKNKQLEVKNKQLQENAKQLQEKDNQLQEKDKKLEELESRLNCVICNERPRDTIFFPCTHFVCCKQCMKRIEDEKCPMCRGPIMSHFQTKLTQ
jgi:chromosome segregation ATPase